jgi:hypothetical protein
MLVHLSNTSPYVCDLNRGPIEQSNRMASAPTKKATALLEHKESFPKATRTPLKLLAPDEVPMDTTATATDINASLQPIWYSEQTIVDDHPVQQEDIASIIQEQQQKGRSLLPRTTLSTILSESPSITDEEALPNQPLLMHKSSTFTIESSTMVDSPLNDSEKENTTNQIVPPTDDSFRALEQLLGLGSTTTGRDSPKTNHDTLSLTVVTPTDIINSTTTSLRMSYAPKSDSDSLPSSQNLPTMATIESINSTNPPSFLIDNTTMEDQGISKTLNQQNSFDNDTMKDEIINDDDTNFSFELNDFSSNSKNESAINVPPPQPTMAIRAPTCADVAYRALIKTRTGGRVSQPVKADSPLAKPHKLRSSAPTSRMLRSSCRRISTETSSQVDQEPASTTECFVNEPNTNSPGELVEIVSLPEEDENEQEKTTSVTLNLSSPKVTEQFSTPTRPMMPMLSREYTYNTPQSLASERCRSNLNSSRATTNQEEPNSSMLGILLTKPTEAAPNVRKSTRKSSSITSKSMLGVLLTQPTETEPSVAPLPVRKSTRKSSSIVSKSMLGVLLTQPTEAEPSVVPSPVRTSTRNSRSIVSKSMLGVLLTQPTEAEPSIAPSPVRTPTRKSSSIVSKSMLGVLLTQPTEPTVAPSPIHTPTQDSPSIVSKSMLGVLLTNPTEGEANISTSSPVQSSIRKSARSSSHPTPRVSINPLHSSTPSTSRHKSLQIVSIGEQEQVSTIVPQSIMNEQQEIEIVQLNETEESLHTIEMGVQTTPSLDISSRRRLNKLEQQGTPIVQMNKSSSIVIVNEEKQITPLQSKMIMNLQRNVRFQLTPSTNARLVAKEKFEENLRGLKPDIVIPPTPIIPEPKPVIVKVVPIKKAAKPKKKVVASKKKKVQKPIEKKSRRVQKVKPVQKQKSNPPPRKESKKKPEPAKRAQRKQPVVEVAVPTKRVQRKQPTLEITAPVKRTQRKQPISEVTAPTKRVELKPPVPEITAPTKRVEQKQPAPEPIKRSSRKRTIPEKIIEQPVVKRVKTSKSIEAPPKARDNSNTNQKIIPEPIKREIRTRSRSTNNKKTIVEPKETTPVIKTSKRRLQSVDKNEGIKKKVEDEKVQPILPVQKPELSQEERQKIEALTVAGLKSRLNTHKADISKGAKKADLIALLIQIETNLIQKQKQNETTPVPTTTMTTRRRKN